MPTSVSGFPHRQSEPGASHARDWVALTVVVTCFALGYALIGLVRHWQFGTNYDLAIFDQAVWHLSRFEPPASTVSGFSNILGDHFHPIVWTLAPLYWIAPRAETLLVAQALLLSSSIVPVYLFLRDRLEAGVALALCIVYGCFWGMQRTALSDFHELAFAPVLIALAILALSRGRLRTLWVVSAALCLVKEDVVPVVVALGMYLFWQGRRRQGALLAAAGLVVFAFVVFVAIPAFNDAGGWGYGSLYADVIRRPWLMPGALFTPAAKLQTIALWLAPFAFLPLGSPLGLILVPIAAERLLSPTASHWSVGNHYTAPLAPILVMAAGDALARLRLRIARPHVRSAWTTGIVGLALVAAFLLPGHQPLLRLARATTYQAIPSAAAAREALAVIPADASVTAQGAIAPHLTHRRMIYLLEQPRDADYVIASTQLTPWPVGSTADLVAMLEGYKDRGYAVAFARDGWTVLRR